jgi:hypothetical protein
MPEKKTICQLIYFGCHCQDINEQQYRKGCARYRKDGHSHDFCPWNITQAQLDEINALLDRENKKKKEFDEIVKSILPHKLSKEEQLKRRKSARLEQKIRREGIYHD